MKKRSLLLAPNQEVGFDELKYPCYGSYKMDGVRVIAYDGELFSRSWKVMSMALHVKFRKLLQRSRKDKVVLDGEIYMHTCAFSDLMGLIKPSAKTIPDDVKYYVFDTMGQKEWDAGNCKEHFAMRNANAELFVGYDDEHVKYVHQEELIDEEQAARYFGDSLNAGYEGLIIRDKFGLYKHGRATLKEATIFKFKEWKTIDARIIGFEQATRMTDDAKKGTRTRDEMGHLERSGEKHTRELVEGIGAFKVETKEGLQFKAGRARDAEFSLDHINWKNREHFVGRWVEIRYMGHGVKDKPRFPRIVRFRDDLE